jgi:hypothetical protein
VPQQQGPRPEPFDINKEQAVSRGLRVVNVLMWPTTPFLRIGCGDDQPAAEALVVALVLPIYAVQMQSPDVFLFWKAWLAAMFIYALLKDKFQYSHFIGHCWLMGMAFKDERMASLVEALLVMGVGAAMPDRGMRWMLVASGGAKLIYEIMHRHIEERERIMHQNARVEMENRVNKLR